MKSVIMRFILLLAVVVAAKAFPFDEGNDMPHPGQLAFVLNEDDFEDYLDEWLGVEEKKWSTPTKQSDSRTTGCDIRVNGDLGQPQPVYLHNDDYLEATGNSGIIHLDSGEEVLIACTGSGRTISHPNQNSTISTATAKCVNSALIEGPWLSQPGEFGSLVCSSNSFHEAEETPARCYNNNIVIRVGFVVEDVFHALYYSCFDQARFEVLYVRYEQKSSNAVHQTGVSRPSWLVSSFYPGVGINNRYTQVTQKATIAALVGDELADKYVTSTQFLARGHLAAKSDFVFATGQRSTFYFINAAPQWQPFNAGNWNFLEQNLRQRIGVAGYNTVIYTGTFGVSQLRNQNDTLVDIYLYTDANNNPGLPVPLYYYKVVYEESLQLGTAFVSINNPYYTEEEVKELTFCTDQCRNNEAFNWLNWREDDIATGYSFCCDVDEFRKTIPHLPDFTVKGILA